jgi:hypothetical protein
MKHLARPRIAVAWLWLTIAGCGSAASAGPEPEVALASSAEAQAQFRAIREQWVSSPLDARVGLQSELTTFVQSYPTDPQGRWARIYLAWIALQRGELDLSERWLALAEPGRAGAARDLVLVVRASLELARGHADAAYRELLELQGRLIDADDRLLCLDQLVLAAQASGHYREAVQHMLELAAQAARRHRERVWRTLEPRLAKVPLPVLEASLSTISSARVQSPGVRPAERAAAADWMRRQILELLSRSALSAQDVALAQRLVATASSSQSDDGKKSELLLLATQGGMERTIEGRTVGLLLQIDDPALMQRSIDMAAGIAATLELAAAERGQEQIVLQTRHAEKGALGEGLARLAGDGATLMLAGLDPEGARLAASFAEERGVPVLLLHEPAEPSRALPPSGYVLGADDAAANQVLEGALKRRASAVIRVGSPSVPCPKGSAEATTLPGLGGELRHVALSFESSAACARHVLMGLTDTNQPAVIGFGLNALGLLGAPLGTSEVWALGAGRLPEFGSPREEELQRWFARKGRAPTWYEALGHDAALIARASIGPAPTEVVRDPVAIAAIDGQVSSALGQAQLAGLWTADGNSFGADHRLRREFHAVKVEAHAP